MSRTHVRDSRPKGLTLEQAHNVKRLVQKFAHDVFLEREEHSCWSVHGVDNETGLPFGIRSLPEVSVERPPKQ